MDYEKLRCLAVLTNVDETVLDLEAPLGLTVSRWSSERAVSVISQLEFLAEHEIRARLSGRYHAITDEMVVFVFEGEIELPSMKRSDQRRKAENDLVESLDEEINFWRLVKDSAVEIVSIYLFHERDGRSEFSFAQSSMWFPEHSVMSVNAADRELLARLKAHNRLPLAQPYLELAREHFAQSFQTQDRKLKFLLLSIAMEVLFNDGPTDIAYRIARGVAVVLSQSRDEGEQLFARMKRMYALRSGLVHRGSASDLSIDHVLELRSLLRRVLVALAIEGVAKDAALKRIAASGYGAWLAT